MSRAGGDGAALGTAAQEILEQARKALSDGGIPDFEAVHEFRKAMKRWRALLRLLEPHLGESTRRLRLRARDLARGLGRTRDAKSAADALQDVVRHGDGIAKRELAKMAALLERERHRAEAVALNPVARKKLAASIRAALRAVARWPAEKLDDVDLASGVAHTYRRARRCRPQNWDTADAEELHELRRRVIEHRYQLELAAPLMPRIGREDISRAQKLRDRLGRCQDLVLLEEFASPGKLLAPWRGKLLPLIGERRSTHVKAAARLAHRLFAERPREIRRRLGKAKRTKTARSAD